MPIPVPTRLTSDTRARSVPPSGQHRFCQGDAEALPLSAGTFDLVTCEFSLLFLVRRLPSRRCDAWQHTTGRVVSFGRVSVEIVTKRAYGNEIGTLRTQAEGAVYLASHLVAAIEMAGVVVDERAGSAEHMEAQAWIEAAGPRSGDG